jgi:hypothetical protein
MGTGNFGARLAHLSPEWRNAVRNIMAWARATQEARGWPEVLFYISDELSNQGEKGGELGRKLVEATRGVAGARIIASLNGPPESRMLPGLDIAMPNHAFPITEATIADIRRNRCEFWVYNIGNSRITWGLFLWRVGATGRFQWKHRVASNEPWNAFDGDNPYLVTWVTPDKPLPTTTLEVIREGLDDLRYVKALENAIAEARASGRPAAAQAADAAQAMLDRLRADIPEDPGYLIGKMDPREAGRPAVGRFADWKYLDELRLVMAEHIQRIQAAAGR